MSWNSSPGSGYGFPTPQHHGGRHHSGQHHHSEQHHHQSGQHNGGYAPPPGPPPGWNSGSNGSTPGGYFQHSSPPGPPPHSNSFPGAQWSQYQQQDIHTGGYYHSPQPQPVGTPYMPPTERQNYGPIVAGGNNTQHQPWFQYSQCNGRRKALCIGINYFGQQNELRGCINDANRMQEFLCRHYGYKPEDIVVLTDDSHNRAQIPTKENIMRAMQWLVRDAQPHDSLFFHYSGHGGQTPDLDGDEADGYDDVIYPVDFKKAGHIVDDHMFFTMVKPLPAGCRLTSVFDCCHSGSALDLPYTYSTEGKIKEPNLLAEAGQGLLTTGMDYFKGNKKAAIRDLVNVVKTTVQKNSAVSNSRQTRTSPADAISWSGCKDNQTSADTVEAGQSTGAMSYAFIKCLTENPHQTYQQFLVSVRRELQGKYSQKPQLSSSHPIDTNILFIC